LSVINKIKKGYIIAIIAAVCWASLGVIGRFAYSTGIDTLTMVTGRSAFACIMTGIYLSVFNRKALEINKHHLPHFLFIGCFGLAANYLCYLSSIKYTTVATSAVLLYTYPSIVSIVSVFVFNEKLDVRKTLALIFTTLGCFLAVGAYAPNTLDLNIKGILYGLGTGLAMAFYSIYGKMLMKNYSSWTISFWGFLFATLAFIAIRPASISYIFSASLYSVFLMFLLGLIPTLLAYGLYTVAVEEIGPSQAAITCTLEPVLASFFSFLILKENMTLVQWSGIFVVIGGVILIYMKTPDRPSASNNREGIVLKKLDADI